MLANLQSPILKSPRSRALAFASLMLATTFMLAPAMAPSEVSAVQIERAQQASATTSAGATSLTLVWPAPTEDGNLLVLAVHVRWNLTVGDIGVPAGWTLAERADRVGFRMITAALYYHEGAPPQSGAVTVTAVDREDRIKMVLAEYRGIRDYGSLDQHAQNVGTSAAPASGTTAPTTDPNELWLGSIASDSGFDQCDPTNSFAAVAIASSGASTLGLYERVASANGPAGVSVTLRPSCDEDSTISLDWAGVVAAFRAGPRRPRACAPIHLDKCHVTTRLSGTPDGDRYNVRCRVQLDASSNGVDPAAETIRLLLSDGDSPRCTAPCLDANVTPRRKGRCWVHTMDPAVGAPVESLKLCELDVRRGLYRLRARSRHANLSCLNRPPYEVGLTIGDDCTEQCSTATKQCPALSGSFPLGQCEANDPSYETCPAAPLCSCVGGACTPSTSSGNSCQAQASSSGGAVFKCCEGATCGFDFSGSGGACITCGTRATCNVDLAGSGGALVDCTNAAQCEVVGGGSGDCRVDCGPNCRVSSPGSCCVTCSSGSPVTCPDGAVVCGRPCPTTSDAWVSYAFRTPVVQTPCVGARYVRYLSNYGKWAGVSLCSPIRHKLFLAETLDDVFYEIGDYAGHGQDHCELVNPSFRIPDEDDITSGGCTNCNIDSAHVFEPPVGSQGWSRARFGEPFAFVSSWPMYNLYTAQWYECGVSVP